MMNNNKKKKKKQISVNISRPVQIHSSSETQGLEAMKNNHGNVC